MKLWKTTIVIWSSYDPTTIEIEALSSDATDGMAYCSRQKSVEVQDPNQDPDWDGTEFFENLCQDDEDPDIRDAARAYIDDLAHGKEE